MTSEDDWDWAFSPRAEDQFAQLGDDTQERIMDKLDEVVSSEWREPGDYLEPLTNSPFKKLRVGDYRLGCRLAHDEHLLRVESVRSRGGAYTADD
ncbi:type II toxin-antitoxin system RelE family toxin [Halodesulfurarchaeum sp.]|uniref:type II toxin-antitoxin system RelE family toxin n=1 Tax=Halodesulfurarchaeum sp. TaxID=1980530 RepID=UPI002FC2ADEB